MQGLASAVLTQGGLGECRLSVERGPWSPGLCGPLSARSGESLSARNQHSVMPSGAATTAWGLEGRASFGHRQSN